MNESFPQKQYPKFKVNRDKEGEITRLVEVDENKEPIEKDAVDTDKETEAVDHSKRRFLKGMAAVAAVSAVGIVGKDLFSEVEEKGTEDEILTSEQTDSNEKEVKEEDPEGKDIFEQLEEFGEIIDMNAAVESMSSDHYHHLIETTKGKARVKAIILRFNQYDRNKLLKPFLERKIDPRLAIALPAHESDWVPRTSSSGALGTHQLMPGTIRALGYKLSDAKDVYKSGEMSAELIKQALKRFNDDMFMAYSDYNAGARLNGFTKKETNKKKRVYSNLGMFVADRLNKEFTELKKEGFVFSDKPVHVTHTVQKGDTMYNISRRYGVDIEHISKENNVADTTLIQLGAMLRIPFKNNLIKEMYQRMPNTMQMIEYAPRLIAMRDAIETLEKGSPESDIVVASAQ